MLGSWNDWMMSQRGNCLSKSSDVSPLPNFLRWPSNFGRFFAKWLNLLFSVITLMFEMERLKGLISFYRLKIIEGKHQHGNISFWIPDKITSQSIFSPPARLIISPSGLLQPRRLPTSHFCIYFADVWYSSDRLHYFFFPSPADESYSSCLHSAKMENWQQMLRLWRESRLRNASAYFDRQRNIHWKIPRAAVLFPALAAPNMFKKSPTAFLKGACVTSPSTSK